MENPTNTNMASDAASLLPGNTGIDRSKKYIACLINRYEKSKYLGNYEVESPEHILPLVDVIFDHVLRQIQMDGEYANFRAEVREAHIKLDRMDAALRSDQDVAPGPMP